MGTVVFSGLIGVSPAPPTTGALAVSLLGETLNVGLDPFDGGDFYVEGTVKVDGTPDFPVRRKVRLFCTTTGRHVRETWSDETTGLYRFDYVRQGPWTVISHDHTGNYNAVVADNITATPR